MSYRTQARAPAASGRAPSASGTASERAATSGGAPLAQASARLTGEAPLTALRQYLDCVAAIERMHRLLLDVIKDEFERLGQGALNPVQALLLFNVAGNEVTAGELKSRGYYQGSNVSYNLKKLVEAGFMHHRRSEVDRRSVRVGLTTKGDETRALIQALFARHAREFSPAESDAAAEIAVATLALGRLEKYWAEQIRYIY